MESEADQNIMIELRKDQPKPLVSRLASTKTSPSDIESNCSNDALTGMFVWTDTENDGDESYLL